MANFYLQPSVDFEIKLTLNEEEARALNALAEYSIEDFIETFYEHLGRYYMEKHEKGLRSLLRSAQVSLPMRLSKVDRAREALQ